MTLKQKTVSLYSDVIDELYINAHLKLGMELYIYWIQSLCLKPF